MKHLVYIFTLIASCHYTTYCADQPADREENPLRIFCLTCAHTGNFNDIKRCKLIDHIKGYYNSAHEDLVESTLRKPQKVVTIISAFKRVAGNREHSLELSF